MIVPFLQREVGFIRWNCCSKSNKVLRWKFTNNSSMIGVRVATIYFLVYPDNHDRSNSSIDWWVRTLFTADSFSMVDYRTLRKPLNSNLNVIKFVLRKKEKSGGYVIVTICFSVTNLLYYCDWTSNRCS
jgi:hypothetical protein